MKKCCLFIFALFLFTKSVVYADDYKILESGLHIPNPRVVFQNKMLLDKTFLTARAEKAFGYWKERVDNSVSGSDNLVTGSFGSSSKYLYYSVSQPRNKTLCGQTLYYDSGKITVTINVASYEDETGTDKDRFAEFISAHEFGHVLGLDDLKFFDTRDSVMSLYADKHEAYKPSYNDFLGVQEVYNFPDAVTYGITGGDLND